MLYWVMLMSLTEAYPVESKPLNNNPETWNFGEGWLLYNPRNSADPSASALIASDPHVKKSKITPKSIFIAPSSYTVNQQMCPNGYRVDNEGKCIKTVTINQDEILVARISELFGIDESPNKHSDIDSDYYDFDDESKSEKDSGPLQFNLPLAIDIEEEPDDVKVEYIIAEKFTMRSLNPKDVMITTEKLDETTTSAPVTESIQSVFTEEPTTNSTTTTIEVVDETTTTTDTTMGQSSTVKYDDDESTNSTLMTTTVEPSTEPSSSTAAPTTTTATTTTQESSTTTTKQPGRIFSVDFLPQTQRKSNRVGQVSARFKNSRDRDKYERPRKQKTTAVSTKSSEKVVTKLHKIERDQVPKKTRTRGGSKRPGNRKPTTSTTEIITETPVITTTTTQKPFWWLPKGWSIDESKEKPVLVRFWAQQPLPHDERARSHSSRQRMNSKMPNDRIFGEITGPELESMLKK